MTTQALYQLFASLDRCAICTTEAYGYRHVHGGGREEEPELMLVLIHPTPGNPTARADWPGPSFPMAAGINFWRVLRDAGLVAPDLPERLAELHPHPDAVELLLGEARRRGLYLTNAIKCVDGGSLVPPAARLAAGWEVLRGEIALARPRRIVALGLLPFRMLTGREVRLADELWRARNGCYTPHDSHPVEGRTYPVYPCYFPTGRGNPSGAREMLAALREGLRDAR